MFTKAWRQKILELSRLVFAETKRSGKNKARRLERKQAEKIHDVAFDRSEAPFE